MVVGRTTVSDDVCFCIIRDGVRYFNTSTPKLDVSVKYIDPSYMVRGIAANATDSILCYELAQNAVHGAMVCNDFGGTRCESLCHLAFYSS